MYNFNDMICIQRWLAKLLRFFFFAYLLEFACEDMILGGDFNLVLDLTVDKKGGNETG